MGRGREGGREKVGGTTLLRDMTLDMLKAFTNPLTAHVVEGRGGRQRRMKGGGDERRGFFLFCFFAFPSYIAGVHHFWVRFLRM